MAFALGGIARALAQAIIADQRQEIAALQNWLSRNR